MVASLRNRVSKKGLKEFQFLKRECKFFKCYGGKSPVYYNGKYFKMNGATMQKPSQCIPITIAAKKEIMMRIAAKYADIWEAAYLSPEQFKSLNTKFDDMCNEFGGRNVIKSIELDVIIANSDSDLMYKEKLFAMERGPHIYNQILQNGLVGKPGKISDRIKEYADAGTDQFFLAFQDPFDSSALELFMDAIK